MAVITCCGTIVGWNPQGCSQGYAARVRRFALVSKCFQNEGTPPYNQAFWGSNDIWDGLLTGTVAPFTQIYATIVDKFNGSFTGEPVYREGDADSVENLSGWNYTISGTALFTPENTAFWQAANGSSDYWAVFQVGDLIFVSAVTVSVAGVQDITNSLTDVIRWKVELKWSGDSASIPESFTKPTEHFN